MPESVPQCGELPFSGNHKEDREQGGWNEEENAVAEMFQQYRANRSAGDKA